MQNVKKYIQCQLADAEIEEERLTKLWNENKADQYDLVKIDAKVDAYNNILRYIKQEEERNA